MTWFEGLREGWEGKSLRGIMPAGIPPDIPNGGGAIWPVGKVFSMYPLRLFSRFDAHQRGNRKVEVEMAGRLGSGRA